MRTYEAARAVRQYVLEHIPLTRGWLRTNSSLYRVADKPGETVNTCDFCTEQTTTVHYGTKTCDSTHCRKHLIGEVWIGGRRFAKWCDGSEG